MVNAWSYHKETNHDPQSLRQDSFRLDQSIKPRPYKSYTDLPVRSLDDPGSLPEPTLEALSKTNPQVSQDVDDGEGQPTSSLLATLCYYATGITKTLQRATQSVRFRAAACTGKLYHINLYAVVGPGASVPPGVYHYDPTEHAIDQLRTGDYRAIVAEAVGTDAARSPVTLIATSEWWRNAWKYRNRTYRHAFWDSGTIIGNLIAGATALDVHSRVSVGFTDDPLVQLLGLKPETEAPVAVVQIGRNGEAAESVSLDPITPTTEPLGPETIQYELNPEAWRQSRLETADAVSAWRSNVINARQSEAFNPQPSDPDDSLDPVDRETASARPLDQTIERRGSLREFSHAPISKRMAGTILDRALGPVPIDGTDSEAISPIVTPYCCILGVDGVSQGGYRYDPNTHTIERVCEMDRQTAGHLALNQSVVGDTAINVYLTVDVEAVVERLGNRGYRLAQLEAGIMLGKLYLATYAHRRLGGRGFTFFDQAVADQFGGDRWPLTMFAFGRRPAD